MALLFSGERSGGSSQSGEWRGGGILALCREREADSSYSGWAKQKQLPSAGLAR